MKPNYETFAMAMWTVEDIHSARESRGYAKWDDEDAVLWFRKHEGRIEDAMVERGWDVIDDLIFESEVN